MNSTIAANAVFDILTPLLSKHTRPSGEDALRASILEPCKDAFRLRMLMRKSKNRYFVETIAGGTPFSSCEAKADAVWVEGGNNSEKSDEVACVVYGALVKLPPVGDQPVKVLEKAQVVLKANRAG
jgi:hypothetical protein